MSRRKRPGNYESAFCVVASEERHLGFAVTSWSFHSFDLEISHV